MKIPALTMLCAVALAVQSPQAEACTRAVYLGPDGMTVTGRTMDWREDPLTNLYIFPHRAPRCEQRQHGFLDLEIRLALGRRL